MTKVPYTRYIFFFVINLSILYKCDFWFSAALICMTNMTRFSACLLFPLIALQLSCGTPVAASSETTPPEHVPISRRQLIENFRQHGKLLFVYGTGAKDAKAPLEAMGTSLKEAYAQQQPFRSALAIQVMADSTVGEAMLQSHSLMLIGSSRGNPLLADALRQVPIDFIPQTQAFKIGKKSYQKDEQILLLSLYPSPWNEELPIFIITAKDPARLSATLNQQYDGNWHRFLRDRWGYEILEGNQRIVMGQFSDDQWEIDWDAHRDFSVKRAAINEHSFVEFVVFEGAENPVAISKLSKSLNAAKNLLEQMSAKKWQATESIKYFIYPSTEQKGLQTGSTRQAHIDLKKLEIHRVIQDEFEGKASEVPLELLVEHLLGTSSTQALRTGLATLLTPQWQGKGYNYWLSRLHEAESLPAPEAFMDDHFFQRESPLVRACVSAAWVAFLMDRWGTQAFFKAYTSWQADQQELQKLRPAWEAYLDELVIQYPKVERKKPSVTAFYKGFNFAHEGYRIYDGYLSEKAHQSLIELQSLGTNAIAIVPYSYMRNPKTPTRFPIPTAAGQENDESVIRAAFHAKKLGMRTMMKPQIWIGGGSWPGDVEMENEAEWEIYYAYYEQWMRHYALLSEIYEFDLLCVGVEFVKVSQHSPEKWKDMIRRFRHIYQGPMTYAANWGEEFEQIDLWSELDYIGIDCYYPLSEGKSPSDQELYEGFRKILGKIKLVSDKYGKPVIFTEIGFRSVLASWMEPHAGERGKKISMKCQKRCYQVVAKSLQGQDWVAGIFWWKWPSYLEYRGKENKGFSPNGKPAEEVLRGWWGD